MATIISNQANATYSFEGSNQVMRASSNIANTTLLDDYNIEISLSPHNLNFSNNENLTYSLLIRNNGIKEIEGLNISIQSDSQTTYKEGSSKLYSDGIIKDLPPTNTEPLSFYISDTLLPGSTFLLIFSITTSTDIPQDTLYLTTTSNVNITSRQTSENEQASATLPRLMSASLNITKSSSKQTIQNNEPYYYTINIENTGLTNANNVTITDTLPEGFNLETITISTNNGSRILNIDEYSLSDRTLTVPLSNLGIDIAPLSQDIIQIILNGTFYIQ